jgi:hypothetical protein
MVSAWEVLITARDEADPQRVAAIIDALREGGHEVRGEDRGGWRVDMGIDPTDDPAMAREALRRLFRSIDEKWDEVLQVEEEPED